MCAIDPKHKKRFILDVFTSQDVSKEDFDAITRTVALETEIQLNASGKLRWHLHEEPEKVDKPKPKKEVKPLDDLDPMPFGKYRGTRMQDVPASYFHWLWTKKVNPMNKDFESPVAEYIRSNIVALKKDHPDGIWS